MGGIKNGWMIINVNGESVTEDTCLEKLKLAKVNKNGFTVTFKGLAHEDILNLQNKKDTGKDPDFKSDVEIRATKTGRKGHVRVPSKTDWVGVQYENEPGIVFVKKAELV